MLFTKEHLVILVKLIHDLHTLIFYWYLLF